MSPLLGLCPSRIPSALCDLLTTQRNCVKKKSPHKNYCLCCFNVRCQYIKLQIVNVKQTLQQEVSLTTAYDFHSREYLPNIYPFKRC